MLVNGDFTQEGFAKVAWVVKPDGTGSLQDIGNIFSPVGWRAWFLHDPEPMAPGDTWGRWDQPEVRDARTADRLFEGHKSIVVFTFGRRQYAGLAQRVRVGKGTRVRVDAQAHAFSNHKDDDVFECWKCAARVRIAVDPGWAVCPVCGTALNRDVRPAFGHADDPRWSEGVGYGAGYLLEGETPPYGRGDDWRNFTFDVGIDPTGGRNPLADTVVWGRGVHIYNEFGEVPAVEAVAQADTITVLTRARAIWPFKHNDAYWGEVTLEIVDEDEEPGPEPPEGGTGEKAPWSKLAPHIMGPLAADAAAVIREGVVGAKWVGEWGSAEGARAGALTVGRVHLPYDALSQRSRGLTPLAAAEEVLRAQHEHIMLNGAIAYWEGHNETVCTTADEMEWFAAHEVERMRLLRERYGKGTVIGNFSAGAPEIIPEKGELWTPFVPACKAALEYEGILGLHEYSCPWMWWMVGDAQPPDGDVLPDQYGWVTLRYRQVYDQYLRPAGAVIPLVITEAGIDGLIPNPYAAGAWRELGGFWASHDNEHDPADYYYRQLVWYDDEARQDKYVAMITVFTWGGPEEWRRFDVCGTPVATALIERARAMPAGAFVYADYLEDGGGTEPQPQKPRGTPREQYDRTYVLLPPRAGADVARVVVDATWGARRWTIGGSADDAGVGDLDVRRVVALNPSEWGDDLSGFYEQYYAGVEYTSVEYEGLDDLRAALDALVNGGGGSEEPGSLVAVRIGFNDWPEGGGQGTGTRWMIENGVRGAVCVPTYIGTDAKVLDYRAAQDAGIEVCLNLRYSWSVDKGGQGTLPPVANERAFIDAAIETVLSSRGVIEVTVGNEANNPREWPHDRALIPADVVRIYNEIRAGVSGRVMTAPGAVDPFYGPGSDCGAWFRNVWNVIAGAEFVDVHGYIRGPDVGLCQSTVQFGDDPLRWQFLNYWGCCETLLEMLPERYRTLPVMVSEFNHLWRTVEPDWGWVTDARAGAVVRAAADAARAWNEAGGRNPVRWLCLYRWSGDEWAVEHNTEVRAAVRAVADSTG